MVGKAADAGEAAAQSKLGWMYENGFGVSSDAAAAARWYRRAAEKGDAAAQNSLGRMTLYGDGAPRDLAAAETWLRMAEGGGDAVAARMAVVNLEELARLRRTMPAEEGEPRPAAARETGMAIAGASAKPERAGGGGLTVRIVETPVVSQPAPFSAGTTVVVPRTRIEIYEGARRLVILDGEKLDPDLIESLNALGLGPEDLAAVLGALGVGRRLRRRRRGEMTRDRRSSQWRPNP